MFVYEAIHNKIFILIYNKNNNWLKPLSGHSNNFICRIEYQQNKGHEQVVQWDSSVVLMWVAQQSVILSLQHNALSVSVQSWLSCLLWKNRVLNARKHGD